MNKILKSGMHKKKNIRNIILIVLAILISLFFYGQYNFEEDKQTLLELKSKAANGEIKYVFDKMEEIKSFSNLPINLAYKRWKKKMYARFVTDEEIMENTSGNKIVYDISNIYRKYWRTEILKENPKNRTDTTLYIKLTDYLLSNKLTSLTRDSLSKTIKNDVELKRIIEKEGFITKFLYRNGFQELLIWDKESIKKYTVALPKDTVNTTVIFIENYHLNGYDHYATFGSSQVGGWAIKESATLYCNRNEYVLNSEDFEVSYLKHESLHFVDLNEYPNLSSTDLEYRSKVIELMYCTEKTIYDKVAKFLNGANSSDRSHSHPYANYILIKNMSEILFNSENEADLNKWKEISVEKINSAALSLYKRSEAILKKDNKLAKII